MLTTNVCMLTLGHGTCSNRGVFEDTSLYDTLEEGTTGLLEPQSIPKDDQLLPVCIVGDNNNMIH